MKKHYTIPVFIPEVACPHKCVYCNQQAITSVHHIPTYDDVIRIIESHLATIPPESDIEVGFLGGSFTGIPKDEMTGYLTQVQSYLERGKISGIRLSTRPDYITPEILEVLKTYHVGTIELGAQSTDEQVLRRAARGHTAEQIRESAGLIKSAGFRLGLQMMLGLPGDNLEKSFRTACDIVSWKADCTRIYPTLVIKDTPLAKMWQKGLYQELSLAETIDWLRTIIPVFENNHVKIIRIGLHPSEGFLDGSELLAGPFHVALKELVMTEVWFDKLKAALTSRAQSAVVYVHPTEIHYAVGHASKNKTRLQKTHPGLFIRQDVAVKPGTCHVDYC